MSNYHIFDNNLVSFKNIDVWPRYGSKTVIFTTRAHIWAYVFWPYLSHFSSNFVFQKIPELRRTISTR